MKTRLEKIAVLAALAIIVIMASSTVVEARIGPIGAQYDRQAMIEEAYFSVTGVVGSHPYPTSNLLGQWNYMTYDIPAQTLMINRVGGIYNAGDTAPVINGKVPYGYKDNIGRGGQCLFFINLLLYRSEADRRDSSSGTCNYCWSYIETHKAVIDNVRPKAGDVVFRPRVVGTNTKAMHLAMVVRRDGDKILIVDSNFANGAGNEEAALRPTTITWLKNNAYSVYTGVSYYNS